MHRGLHDDEWERIKDLLPGGAGSGGVTAANNRLFRRRGVSRTDRSAIVRFCQRHLLSLVDTN
jgi:hypothetical protein